MTGDEVRKLSAEDLQTRLKTMRVDLFKLRQKAVTEKVEKSHEFRLARADIARVLTEMNARRHKANPRKSTVEADVKGAAPKVKARAKARAAATPKNAPARKTPRVARKKSAASKA